MPIAIPLCKLQLPNAMWQVHHMICSCIIRLPKITLHYGTHSMPISECTFHCVNIISVLATSCSYSSCSKYLLQTCHFYSVNCKFSSHSTLNGRSAREDSSAPVAKYAWHNVIAILELEPYYKHFEQHRFNVSYFQWVG